MAVAFFLALLVFLTSAAAQADRSIDCEKARDSASVWFYRNSKGSILPITAKNREHKGENKIALEFYAAEIFVVKGKTAVFAGESG
jgi:hypothetical protein